MAVACVCGLMCSVCLLPFAQKMYDCDLNMMFFVSVAQRMYVGIKMALSRQLRGRTSARGRIYF